MVEEAIESIGYTVIELLDAAAVAALRAAVDAVGRPRGTGFVASLYHPDPAYRTAIDTVVRAAVEPALGRLVPDRRLAFGNVVVKPPAGASSAVPLHLDWSFVDEPDERSSGLWCPLADVSVESGGLELVAGSHRLGHARRGAGAPFPYPHLETALRARFLQPMALRAGQAVVFDHGVVHASPPNRTGRDRVAVAGVLVRRDAGLRYHHIIEPTRPDVLEVFAVDDAFYLRHQPGVRPRGMPVVGVVMATPPRLDEAGVAAVLGPAADLVRRRAAPAATSPS